MDQCERYIFNQITSTLKIKILAYESWCNFWLWKLPVSVSNYVCFFFKRSCIMYIWKMFLRLIFRYCMKQNLVYTKSTNFYSGSLVSFLIMFVMLQIYLCWNKRFYFNSSLKYFFFSNLYVVFLQAWLKGLSTFILLTHFSPNLNFYI